MFQQLKIQHYQFDELAANNILNEIHSFWVGILHLPEHEHLQNTGQVNQVDTSS